MSLPIITTIQTNINNLKSTKTDIKNAVNTDYDFIANEQIESYPGLIKQGIAYYKNRVPHATKEGTDLSFNSVPLKFENMTIKGNTEQASYEGKNLISISDGTYTGNGYTAVVSNGKITVNGTGLYTPSSVEIPLDNPINWSANVPLVLSAFNPVAQGNTSETGDYFSLRIGSANNPNVVAAILGNQNATASKTRTTDMEITRLQIRGYTDGEFNNFVCYPQLELDSNIGNYEPYVGGVPSPNPDYPQDIHVVTGNNTVEVQGKNLFDKDNYNIKSLSTAVNTSGGSGTYSAATNQKHIYIPCKPSTDYVVIKDVSNISVLGIYETATEPALNVSYTCLYYSSNSDGKRHITTSANAQYLDIRINTNAITQNEIDTIVSTLLIAEGTDTNISYEPYFTPRTYSLNLGNIELCKIGNYQDYLYKENGNWYKYNAIGKVIFVGNEAWVTASATDVKRFVCNTLYDTVIPETDSKKADILSNKFIVVSANNTASKVQGIAIAASSKFVIYCEETQNYNSAQFREWLSSNNVIAYYALGTPVITQITDETLISQLEALDKANGNNGTTIITSTGTDLAPILNFTAYLKEVE